MENDKKVRGTTNSGFGFELDKDAMNDMELLEELSALDKGDATVLPSVMERLVGAEQKKALYDHVRNEKGRVPIDKIMQEVKEIFESCKEVKN